MLNWLEEMISCFPFHGKATQYLERGEKVFHGVYRKNATKEKQEDGDASKKQGVAQGYRDSGRTCLCCTGHKGWTRDVGTFAKSSRIQV
jgi:hypothetical protein